MIVVSVLGVSIFILLIIALSYEYVSNYINRNANFNSQMITYIDDKILEADTTDKIDLLCKVSSRISDSTDIDYKCPEDSILKGLINDLCYTRNKNECESIYNDIVAYLEKRNNTIKVLNYYMRA